MSGRPLFIYKKGEPYPRQVVYNPSTGRVEADAEPTMSMAPPQGPKPSALAMAWYRFRARNGHTPSQNFLEWQRYEDFGVASKNVSDKRRVRRRRNDAILSSRYKNSGLNSGRNQNKHIAQTLISALKGPLGFGAELGAKGRNGLDELLTDGSIVNAYGQPICSKKPGSREAQYEAIGNWFTKSKQALYIYKPGEKYPHEVFLDSAGRVRISKDTIDKIPNENIKKPNFWQRMMDWFGQRNPAAFKYGRMLNRQAILRQAESAEWQRKRDELNKKHDLHPIRTEKTKEELKAAVEQKKQREAQNEQPTPEKQVEQLQKTIQQPTPEPKTQQPQQVQQPQQPQQTQPKPMTLEEQLAALQVQTKQMLERMSALEAQIRQQNQPVKTEAQPVKEEKSRAWRKRSRSRSSRKRAVN